MHGIDILDGMEIGHGMEMWDGMEIEHGMEFERGMEMLDGMEICNLCPKKPQCQYQQSKRIVLNWQSLSQ